MTSPDSVSDARNRVLIAGVSKEHRILEVGACDWWVEWIEEGPAVEFFGHLIPGAPGFRGEEEDQQHSPDLLMDLAHESEEQWRSFLASKSQSHTIVPKWLARFIGMKNPLPGNVKNHPEQSLNKFRAADCQDWPRHGETGRLRLGPSVARDTSRPAVDLLTVQDTPPINSPARLAVDQKYS